MLTQPLRVALLAAATACLSSAANAASPSLHGGWRPDHYQLPVFGMHSFNNGYGEEIVSIRHGGLACELGLERGDVIERLNGFRLSYHGSWERALSHAMADGGHIVLKVRDVHTGRLVNRHIDLDPYGNIIDGPVGPITPKVAPVVHHSVGYPSHGQPVYNPPVYRRPPSCGTPKIITPKHVTPKFVTPKSLPKISFKLHN